MSSIITRNGRNNGGKTQMYTWAACIMVFVFAFSMFFALKSNKKSSDSQEVYKKQAFDLGNMPFDDDSTEAYLLASSRYNDIARKDLINGLFSRQEKEARQEDDAVNGVPAAPDKEYKEAAEAKNAKKIRSAAKKSQPKKEVAATSKGSLNKGSMASVSGGGGARGTTVNNAPARAASGSKMKAGDAALLNQVKNGKAIGFQHAVLASAAAANANNLESAASNAVDAFQKGAQEVGKETLETELEDNSNALNVDEEDLKSKLERAGNSDELKDLNKKLEAKKKEKEAEKAKTCAEDPFANAGCVMVQVLDIAKSVAGPLLGGLFGK